MNHVDDLRALVPTWAKGAIKRYTRVTSAFRTYPDFLIIGARRCGTTSLYNYLARHRQVLPALTKEVSYFRHYYDAGPSWYRSCFPTTWEKRFWAAVHGAPILTGEATPSYMYDVEVAERVRDLLPRLKLLAIVRDPPDAFSSAYRFGLKCGLYTKDERPFGQLVEQELAALYRIDSGVNRREQLIARARVELGRYIYVDQLELWMELFGKEQVFVVVFDDLTQDPAGTMERVCDYLGLPPRPLKSYTRYNLAGYDTAVGDEPRAQMDEFFAPYHERLSALLDRDLNWGRNRRTG